MSYPQPLGVWSRTYTFDAYEVGNIGNWGKLRYGAGYRECRTGNNSGKLGINQWKPHGVGLCVNVGM